MKHHPTAIKLRTTARLLEIRFSDDAFFALPCEYLRVHSPSAEVRGHGPGQEVLQIGKEQVNITAVEPVGQYAVRLIFSDGHDSGIFSWDVLYDLGSNQDNNWNEYLNRLEKAGHPRQPEQH